MVGAVALVVALVVIIVLAAKGCGPGVAPGLTGKTLAEATTLAEEAGLKLVTTEVPNFAAAGTVLSQNPMVGIKTTDGTIQVTVSRAPVQVQINSMEPFDPAPGDGVENNAQRPILTDDDETTSLVHRELRVPHLRE